MIYKIGQKVRILKIEKINNFDLIGRTGKIITIAKSNILPIGVEFDDYIKGHDCGGKGKKGHCRWVKIDEIELIKKGGNDE